MPKIIDLKNAELVLDGKRIWVNNDKGMCILRICGLDYKIPKHDQLLDITIVSNEKSKLLSGEKKEVNGMELSKLLDLCSFKSKGIEECFTARRELNKKLRINDNWHILDYRNSEWNQSIEFIYIKDCPNTILPKSEYLIIDNILVIFDQKCMDLGSDSIYFLDPEKEVKK